MMIRFEDKRRLGMLADKISGRLHSFPRRSHVAANKGQSEQTDQSRKVLLSGSTRAGQFLRSKIDPLGFRCGPSLNHHQHLAERSLELKLPLVARQAVSLPPEQIQGGSQMLHRILIG